MTLADLIPSLRSSLPHPLEPWLWPTSTHHIPGGDLSVGGASLVGVAAQHGTPSYVLDLGEFRARCAAYRHAFHDADVVYAGKALLTRAVARIIDDEDLGLDVCSAGELALAAGVRFPVDRITLHGNAKPAALLRRAIPMGVGRIVIDSLDEIATLAAIGFGPARQRVLIRVTPGVDAHTHRAITTGTDDQKFGLAISSGAAAEAVRRVLTTPALELVGVHCHVGSQVTRTAPYEQLVARLVAFLAAVHDEHGLALPELNVGGGHAIAYHPGDVSLAPGDVHAALSRSLRAASATHRLPVPRLTVEPGRAIAGPAGITVYRVLTVKHRASRTWVAVDGGLSNNPRPALYGARYTARLLGRLSPFADEHVTVVGQHCEAGDMLIEDALLPSDIHAGDLLAVPATGAYHHSMASTYNLTPRPPVIGVSEGRSRVLVRRETVDDLLARDLG
jgi:diaminopimelate decarboxylase